MRHRLAVLALAAALLGACGSPVLNPVTGQTERSVMSEAEEIEAGRKAHDEVLQQYGRLDNPRVQALVAELGQRLARQSHRANLPWTFTVLDSPEINAFALPGGYVYVTRGILAYMASEADLAGVLGHEIGHVTARHSAQRATRAQDAGLGVLAATVLGAVLESAGGVGGATRAAGELSQTAAAGYVARYSREQESQADALGAEYLQRNRLDPRHLEDVIRLLRDQERFAAEQARAEGRTDAAEGAGNDWLASHPSNEQRLADIRQVAARYSGSYADPGAARYLQAIDGLAFGDSPAQGLTRGQDFIHPGLGIALTAPAGWAVQNSAQAVVLLNPTRDAALVMRPAPVPPGTAPAQTLRALQVEQARTEPLQLNGLPATRFAGLVRDERGQAVAVQGLLVSGPDGRAYLLSPAARNAAALQRAAAGLRQAEGSVRPLSAADRAAARPWVLRSVPYPRGGFAELARGSPLGPRAEAQLRLLNGAYEGGEPRPGQPVKVVVAS